MPDQTLRNIAADAANACQLTLDDFLGEGAFKETYRAIDASGQPVALKVARSSESIQPRLERETLALGDCDHPGIARLIRSFESQAAGDKYWITIEEYIGGGTLTKRLAQTQLNAQAVRSILVPLAKALEHLHAKQLVHRDIKPENILFRSTGEPVLTDFGLVRMLDKSSLTHDHFMRGPGTPMYAAPEQLLNLKAEIDWRTDQFALALVGCRCLLGVHPFAVNGTAEDAVERVAARNEIDPAARAALEKAGLSCLVRALDPWPVKRYRRPGAFIADLEAGNLEAGR